MWTANPPHRSHKSTGATGRYSSRALSSSEQSYLALAEHVPQVDNLGSYDMAVTPALIVHGILAFTALAFISCDVFGRV
jgi:hypothetical protein